MSPRTLVSYSLLLAAASAFLSACSSTAPTASFYASQDPEAIVAAIKIEPGNHSGDTYRVEAPPVENEQDDTIKRSTHLEGKLNTPRKMAQQQLLIDLNYPIPRAKQYTWSFFERAHIRGSKTQTTQALSRKTSECDDQHCLAHERLLVKLSKQQLTAAVNNGLRLSLLSRDNTAHAIDLPANYFAAYQMAINRVLSAHDLSINDFYDAQPLKGQAKYPRGYAKAETMAKTLGCTEEELQTLRNDGPQAIFQAVCPGEKYKLIKCEWGNCQVIQ